VNTSATNPSVPAEPREQTFVRAKGPFNIVRRLLRRKESSKNSSSSFSGSAGSSVSASTLLKPSITERLASYFTEDLPATTVPPPMGRELSTEIAIGEKDDGAIGAQFTAIRALRAAAKEAVARFQDAYAEIENNLKERAEELERHRQEVLSTVASATASLRELQAVASKDLTVGLQKASQLALVQFSQQLQERAETFTAGLNEKFNAEKESFTLEMQKQFEGLRASIQRQLVVVTQSTFDSLTKDAVEKAGAELDTFERTFVDDIQKQLTSKSRSSLELLTEEWKNGLIERLRAEIDASRLASIEQTHGELNKITRAYMQRIELLAGTRIEQTSTDLAAAQKQFIDDVQKRIPSMAQTSLEPYVQAAIMEGRKQLTQMVDAFLAKSVPEIEAELRKLVERGRESLRQTAVHPSDAYAQAPQLSQAAPVYVPPARSQAPDLSRETSPRPGPPRTSTPEFTLGESATKRRRLESREVRAAVSWGLGIGLLLGVMALVLLGVYYSMSPVVRLRATPPTAFLDESPRWTLKQRAAQNQLARAYWDIAVREIGTKYSFGSQLPVDPPDNFKVEEKAGTGTASKVDAAARARYWEKLREVWPQPDSWERTSNWNLEWLSNAWDSISFKVVRVFGPRPAPAH